MACLCRGLCRSGPRLSGVYQPILSVPSKRIYSSTQASAATPSPDELDLETGSSLVSPPPDESNLHLYDPVKQSIEREIDLPASRYQYHPPKYRRGPLHPIQSPPSSDPIARDFVPGPFNLPRLRHTYDSTIASDLMTLAYLHHPPGLGHGPASPIGEPEHDRLPGWDNSSPYHKNRARRGPRGGTQRLPPRERDMGFLRIPTLSHITVATYVPAALKDRSVLVVAENAIQAITGVVPTVTRVKKNVSQWKILAGEAAGVKATMYGNSAWEFLDRCINLVFPRIKEWKGIDGTTGDSAGNLAWGFKPQDLQLFPEIEVNIDAYPAKMIPGARVFVNTTATSDRHARLLLQAMGMVFYGEMKD